MLLGNQGDQDFFETWLALESFTKISCMHYRWTLKHGDIIEGKKERYILIGHRVPTIQTTNGINEVS